MNNSEFTSAVTEVAQVTPEQQRTDSTEKENNRIPRRKKVFTMIFGIIALLFAITAANCAMIITLLGFSVAFTEAGLIPMASCLVFVLTNSAPGVLFGVLSQKLGTVCGLNKVSVALSISSAVGSTVIFLTLSFLVFLENFSFGI